MQTLPVVTVTVIPPVLPTTTPVLTYDNYFSHFPNYDAFFQYVQNIKDDTKLKGDLLEWLAKDLFYVHPRYNIGVKDVHLSREAPQRIWDRIGIQRPPTGDIGTDIFVEYEDDTYAIIQAKCYEREALDPQSLGTFFFAKNISEYNNGAVRHFYVISTCRRLTHQLNTQGLNVEYILDDIMRALPDLFDRIRDFRVTQTVPIIRKTLYEDQQECVNMICQHLSVIDKVIILMMCGLGKSFTSVMAFDALRQRIPMNSVIIFVPTIALATQTLESWKQDLPGTNASTGFLVVSSERTYNHRTITTTNPDVIRSFMQTQHSLRIVVCVYDSSPLLREYPFDLGIFDEAHHTVTLRTKPRYSIIDSPRIQKKISMTATARICQNPENRSMDREADYGPIIFERGLGVSIENNRLNDYNIAIYTNASNVATVEYEGKALPSTYGICMKGILDVIQSGNTKILTYHNSINHAKAMVSALTKFLMANGIDASVATLHSKMSNSQRRNILERFRSEQVAILCTVAIFKEGIDVPRIDGVVFCDPKHAKQDIIQCIGRCLRKDQGKLKSVVILPLDEEEDNPFETIREVLVTLAQKDHRIFDEILRATRDKRIGIHRVKGDHPETFDDNMIQLEIFLKEIGRKYSRDT